MSTEAYYRNARRSYLGPTGQKRKAAMLTGLEHALRTTTWRDLKVNDVTIRAASSNALFYNYFSSLEEAFEDLWGTYAQAERIPPHLVLIHDLLEFEKGLKKS